MKKLVKQITTERCPKCKGRGTINADRWLWFVPFGQLAAAICEFDSDYQDKCPFCRGTGTIGKQTTTIITEDEPCPADQ
jgi:DnaJ-class molecular chaperone